MKLELCFAYQSGGGPDALDVALEWRDFLECHLTIFTDVDCLRELNGNIPSNVTVVNLNLSERVNQYGKHTTGLRSWSPWGTKSGPNYQYFRILKHYATSPADTWLLYLESDTYCSVTNPRPHIEELIRRHPTAWIIGAPPSDLSLPYIDVTLHDHINGASLLNIGDPRFHAFLSRTWVPSLLWKIRSRPYFAYDCATATLEWQTLPSELRFSWQAHHARFVRTSSMLNLSNIQLPVTQVIKQLQIQNQKNHLMKTKTWFVHVKLPPEEIDGTSRFHKVSRNLLRHHEFTITI
jgi:hypothetical protein